MSPNLLKRFTPLVLLISLVILLPLAATAQQEPPAISHTVMPGETLYGIAARYGVTAQALAEANDIADIDLIRVGGQLVIPAPPGQRGRTHIVQPGEYLALIAGQYDVTVQELVLANNLLDLNYVYVGQRLFIPVVAPAAEAEPAAPAPQPTTQPAAEAPATPPLAETPVEPAAPADEPQQPAAAGATSAPPTCPAGCEAIGVISPTVGMTVTSPVTVSGLSAGLAGPLAVRVLDEAGVEIGAGRAASTATGAYAAAIAYTEPITTQLGRIQVYSVSPRDGAIAHLASAEVVLQGAGSASVVDQLQAALAAQDFEALRALMAEQWVLGFHRSAGLVLSPEQAIAQLQNRYFGAGDILVDPSLAARTLLGDQVTFSPNVTGVLYSTGWGPDGGDDAFLLLVEDEQGRTRWGGMFYVFEALRTY